MKAMFKNVTFTQEPTVDGKKVWIAKYEGAEIARTATKKECEKYARTWVKEVNENDQEEEKENVSIALPLEYCEVMAEEKPEDKVDTGSEEQMPLDEDMLYGASAPDNWTAEIDRWMRDSLAKRYQGIYNYLLHNADGYVGVRTGNKIVIRKTWKEFKKATKDLWEEIVA